MIRGFLLGLYVAALIALLIHYGVMIFGSNLPNGCVTGDALVRNDHLYICVDSNAWIMQDL